MQTKKDTAIEVAVNTIIGLIGNWFITASVINTGLSAVYAATIITVLCTIWSVGRNYLIRRHFNKKSIQS